MKITDVGSRFNLTNFMVQNLNSYSFEVVFPLVWYRFTNICLLLGNFNIVCIAMLISRIIIMFMEIENK